MIKELSKSLEILSKPYDFFHKARKEKTINESVRFLAVFSVIYSLLYFMFKLAMGVPDLSAFPNMFMAWIVSAGMLVTLIIIVPIVTVISTIIYHPIAFILKCRKGLPSTFKAVVYSSAPVFILGWIPFVTFISSLWSIALMVIAISKLHEVSMKRAFMTIVPLYILFISLTLLFSGNADMILGAHSSELLGITR